MIERFTFHQELEINSLRIEQVGEQCVGIAAHGVGGVGDNVGQGRMAPPLRASGSGIRSDDDRGVDVEDVWKNIERLGSIGNTARDCIEKVETEKNCVQLTFFFWIIAYDFIVVGEIGRKLTLESSGLLRPQLPSPVLFFCIGYIWVQPV